MPKKTLNSVRLSPPKAPGQSHSEEDTLPQLFGRKNRLNDFLSSQSRLQNDEGLYKRKKTPFEELDSEVESLKPKRKRGRPRMSEEEKQKAKEERERRKNGGEMEPQPTFFNTKEKRDKEKRQAQKHSKSEKKTKESQSEKKSSKNLEKDKTDEDPPWYQNKDQQYEINRYKSQPFSEYEHNTYPTNGNQLPSLTMRALHIDNDAQAKMPTFSDSHVMSSPVKNGQRRRPSYYSRGKRVSSIGNGFAGEPHADVSPDDYYKLLDTGIPEPDRMRQLLIWCVKKRMEQKAKPQGDTVHNIANVIKEELLRDLMEKSVSTSWYGRGETAMASGKEVVIPNPLNVQNVENIRIYKEKLHSIIRQKQECEDAYKRAVEAMDKIRARVETVDDTFDVNDKYPGIMDVADALEKSEMAVRKQIGGIEPSVDRLFHSAYRLDKVVEAVRKREIGQVVSERLGTVVKRGGDEEVRRLLRGLTRIHT